MMCTALETKPYFNQCFDLHDQRQHKFEGTDCVRNCVLTCMPRSNMFL